MPHADPRWWTEFGPIADGRCHPLMPYTFLNDRSAVADGWMAARVKGGSSLRQAGSGQQQLTIALSAKLPQSRHWICTLLS